MPSFSELSNGTAAAAESYTSSEISNGAVAAAESTEEVSSEWFHDIAIAFARNLNLTPPRDLDLFPTVFNMTRRTFEYVCSLVREDMFTWTPFTFTDGRQMSLYDQVAVALRRFSSTSSLNRIGASIGVNTYTVSQLGWNFVGAMIVRGKGHLRWPQTEQEKAVVKSKLEQIGGLPNCCGAVDVTHILLMLSRSEPAVDSWLDHHNNNSMVVMGIVDADMRFMDVTTGLPGSLADSKTLQNSEFFQFCQTGEILNGEKVRLSEEAEMQEYIVGDEGFPLLPWLMTPYQGHDLSETQADFNRRLMATHAVSQKAFARLKEMWKMIDGVVWRPEMRKLPWYVIVCCMLHNIIIDLEDEILDTLPAWQNHDPGYETRPSDYADGDAVISRDMLSQYLAGRVDP